MDHTLNATELTRGDEINVRQTKCVWYFTCFAWIEVSGLIRGNSILFSWRALLWYRQLSVDTMISEKELVAEFVAGGRNILNTVLLVAHCFALLDCGTEVN